MQVWLSACNEAYDLAMELLEGNGQATRSAQANDEVIEQQPTIMAASPFASEPVDAPEEIINPPSPTKSDNGAQIDQPTAANMTPVGTPARAPDTIAMVSCRSMIQLELATHLFSRAQRSISLPGRPH